VNQVIDNKMDQPELLAVTEFLATCMPFDQLSGQEQAKVASQLKIVYYRRGHVFKIGSDEPDGLRILRSGAIEIRSQEGQLADCLAETESFNLAGLESQRQGVQAILIEDSLIYVLPKEDYQYWREKHRFFDRYFHGQRRRRIRRAARYEPDVEANATLRPIVELMSKNVLTVSPQMSIRNTAELMNERRVSSILILDQGELCGILTDRDMRSRVVAEGIDIERSVEEVMTLQPYSINNDTTAFDATLQMTRQGCHHLPIVNHAGSVVGIVTASDLMLAKRDDPVYLVQHISRQADAEGMKEVVSSLPDLMQGWVAGGLRPLQISKILTAISDAITQRLIQLAIKELGDPPVPFAWLGFGSQARSEQLLGADQDNGLLIDDSMLPEHDEWFKKLSHIVCDGLDLCGYVYCNGEIMATTDKWRQPLHKWCQTIDSWTRSPTPDAVMRVSIFFDVRVVFGSQKLGRKLQSHMLEKTGDNSIFLAALASNVLEHSPPLGIFRRFLVERSGEHRDSFDLKKRGILPIIDMVRIHSLSKGVKAVNTSDRIQELIKTKAITLVDGRNLQDAFDCIMQIRIEHQECQLRNGEKPDNYCNPKNLNDLSSRHLRDSFTVVHDAQEAIRLNYRGGLN
jgi:CBS domain-containing protein